MNQIEKYNEFEAQLVEIENACNFIPDVSTKEGYEKSKRIGLDGRKVEKAIDDKRLEMKKDAMKTADEIHEAGKALCDRVAKAYKPHQEAYKAHDAEKKRLKEEEAQRVTDRINLFCVPMEAHSMSSGQVGEIIDSYNNDKLEGFGNRTIEAGNARNKAVEELTNLKAAKIVQEEEAKRLDADRAEMEKQREERAKAQAIIDEANRIEAEKQAAERAKLEEERRQQEEKERIAKAQEDAATRERERIEREDAEAKAAAEKKAANKAHRKSINNEALKCLVDAEFSEDDGKRIIELIAQGRISHITINY